MNAELEQYVVPPTEDDEPERKGPRPFTIWKPSQFLAYTPLSDAIILGDAVVERRKWTSVIGVGGLGKTRWVLHLAICQIIRREKCCDLPVHGKPLRWLILSPENGLRRWQSDLKAMLAPLIETECALVEENLSILALADDEDGDLNTGNPAAMARLAITLREQKPDVIVFDPFADMVDGDENKTQDVISTLRTMREVVRKEAVTAAVLLIHHGRTGAANIAQAGDNYNAGNFGRGAKALYSAVRAEIQLSPGDRDNANRLVLSCGKNSDGPKFSTRGIIFNPEDCSYSIDPDFDLDAWRADVSGTRGAKSCTITDAVEAVRELAPKPGDEAKTKKLAEIMIDATGASLRTCKDRLADALEAGFLRKGSRRGLYRLGPKPLPQANVT